MKRAQRWLGSLLLASLACAERPSAEATRIDAGEPSTSAPTPSSSADADLPGPGENLDGSVSPEPGSGIATDAAGAPVQEAGGPDSGSSTRAITLRFKAAVGTRPFVCGAIYGPVGLHGYQMAAADFRFHAMALRLINAAGEQVPIQLDTNEWQNPIAGGVALLDFEDMTETCKDGREGTEKMNTIVTGTAPVDDYRGVAFVVGVPEELNYRDPATLPDPLRARNMHWEWLWGYRFLKMDLFQPSDASWPPIYQIHVASIGCNLEPAGDPNTTCKRPNRNDVRLMGFDPERSVIVADLAPLLAELDLTVSMDGHVCRSGLASECAKPLRDLGIDFETGEPLTTQTVFRIETGPASPSGAAR